MARPTIGILTSEDPVYPKVLVTMATEMTNTSTFVAFAELDLLVIVVALGQIKISNLMNRDIQYRNVPK